LIEFKPVVTYLRVPNLQYAVHLDKVDFAVMSDIEKHLLSNSSLEKKSSLIQYFETFIGNKQLTAEIINCLYLADRTFDSWKRKAHLQKQLFQEIDRWRSVFAWLLINTEGKTEALSLFISLINDIQKSQLCWTDKPENIARPLLRQLDKIHSVIFSPLIAEPDYLREIFQEWQNFLKNQQSRFKKVVARLVEMEIGTARRCWAESLAWYWIYKENEGERLPASVQKFLKTCWYPVLKKKLITGGDVRTRIELKKLTENICWIFNNTNQFEEDKIYSISSELLEKITTIASEVQIPLSQTELTLIETPLYKLLKQEEIDFEVMAVSPKKPIQYVENIEDYDLSDISKKRICLFDLDVGYENQEPPCSRFYIIGKIEYTRDLLAVNHAGMKYLVLDEQLFQGWIESHKIKKINIEFNFQRVFNELVKGLDKIVKVQIRSREETKIKARKEAEAIVIAKRKAQYQARIEDEERIKKVEKAHDDAIRKQKINEIREVAEKVDRLLLGAWVEFLAEDNSKEKYKLAVKINSSQKFIFVDRYGLKRREIIRRILIENLLTHQARIITFGENISDSLERVVGRMRIGK